MNSNIFKRLGTFIDQVFIVFITYMSITMLIYWLIEYQNNYLNLLFVLGLYCLGFLVRRFITNNFYRRNKSTKLVNVMFEIVCFICAIPGSVFLQDIFFNGFPQHEFQTFTLDNYVLFTTLLTIWFVGVPYVATDYAVALTKNTDEGFRIKMFVIFIVICFFAVRIFVDPSTQSPEEWLNNNSIFTSIILGSPSIYALLVVFGFRGREIIV